MVTAMTREEAIEILKKNRPDADTRRCGLELCTAVDVAISALREQCVRDATKTSDWIPVEERLPEDDLPPDTDRVAIKVLTVTKHGTRRFVRELTRQRWCWKGVMQPWSWSKDAIGVTHWMPLPEPPEVEV